MAGHWCAGGAGLSFRRTSKGDRHEQRRVVAVKGAAEVATRGKGWRNRAGRARRVIRRAAVAAMGRRSSRRSWRTNRPVQRRRRKQTRVTRRSFPPTSAPLLYRLLGHGGVTFTQKQLESLVGQGLLTPDTKVIAHGETFAAPLGARPEFEHLRQSSAQAPGERDGR